MTWTIVEDLKTETINGVANVVTQARWNYEYVNGTSKCSTNQLLDFPYDPSAPFIQYADLTEATVVGWVKSTLGSDAVTFYENTVQTKLDEAIAAGEAPRSMFISCEYTPTTNQPAPWAAE